MHLRDVLRDECLVPNQSFSSKDAALQSIARLAAASPALAGTKPEAVLKELRSREELGSTGFGDGIAIPHCRMAKAKDFVVGMITVPDGMDFAALDGAPVRVLVFIIAPDTATDQHIRLLSRISEALGAPGVFAGLLSAPDAKTLRAVFLRTAETAEDTAPEPEAEPSALLHVLARGEETFGDALSVLNSVDHGGLAVVDCDSGAQYLRRMPLFCAFWADTSEEVYRMVVVVLRKSLVNETIRRLERRFGRLDKCPDLLVTVQDLLFCAGGLTA